MRPAGRSALLALLLVAGPIAACGGDDPGPEASDGATTTVTAGDQGNDGDESGPTSVTDAPPLEDLVPEDVALLRDYFGEALAPLDLRVTRGGITEFRGGRHLALYVEPTTAEADNGPEVYLDRMLTSFLAIRPLLFDTYPDLDSFDLCQEVVPAADQATPDPSTGGDYEEPVTLLLLTREGYDSVDDWGSATLADLLDAASEARGGYSFAVTDVAALPGYREALPVTTTTTPTSAAPTPTTPTTG